MPNTTQPPDNHPSQPSEVEAEEALIGCVLIDPYCFGEVYSDVKPEMFFLHKHRFIWQAFAGLWQDGQNIDLVTTCAALNSHLDEIGGAAYLTRLITVVPTSQHALSYAATVATSWKRRQLLESATALARDAYNPDKQPDKTACEHAEKIKQFGVVSRGQRIKQSEAFAAYFEEKQAEIDDDATPRRITTGWRSLDIALGGGWLLGKLNIVHGHAGFGKTSLLAGGSYRQARQGIGVGVFQIEEEVYDWIELVVNSTLDIDRTYRQLRGGGASEAQIKSAMRDDLARVAERGDMFHGLPFNYYTGGRCTIDTIEREARAMVREMPEIRVIYIDNMNFIDAQAGRGNESMAIGVVAMRLSALAKDIGAAIVLIVHDSKESVKHDGPPTIGDLYMSHALYQTTRCLICVHPDEQHPDYRASIDRWRNQGVTWSGVPYRWWIQKNNKGSVGSVPAFFTPAYQKFAEVDNRGEQQGRTSGGQNGPNRTH